MVPQQIDKTTDTDLAFADKKQKTDLLTKISNQVKQLHPINLFLLTCQGPKHKLEFWIVSNNYFCHVTYDKIETGEKENEI